MTTPTRSPNPVKQTFQLGGTLAGTPQPDEPFYPLRCDQFLTMCDGEMSEMRSARDICLGSFVTGIVGLLTLDWNFTRHPLLTTLLCSLTLAALLVAALTQWFIHRMRTRSAYSRVVGTIQRHFKISP